MKYTFMLKDNNQKAYNGFVWFLFYLHLIAAAVVALNTNDEAIRLSMYILLGFYTIVSAGYFFLRKQKKAFTTYALIMALLYGNFWFKYTGVIAFMIFLGVYVFILYIQSKKAYVSSSEAGISITGILKTMLYPWQQLDNVILKDNILTIDFKTNKIIQSEIVEEAAKTDEINFNLFCKAQLKNNA